MHRSRRRSALLACLFASLCAVAFMPGAHALSFSVPTLFVFGDSLADIGNDLILTKNPHGVPTIPPSFSPYRTYRKGRFSNGPLGVEQLWWRISKNVPDSRKALKPSLSVSKLAAGQSLNFAFGGAGTGLSTTTPTGFTVPGLLGQVQMFKDLQPSAALAAPALYVLIAGSNDYVFSTPAAPADPVAIVGNIATAIQELYALGARNFLVLNVPDLGAVPLIPPEAKAGLTYLSGVHNQLLAQTLASLPAQLAQARIIAFDLASAAQNATAGMNTLVPALETFGYPGLSFCLFTNPATCRDVPSFKVDPSYFYWDAEHPTATVHKLLGDKMYEALP
jgi:phospholipase/lecithinase/hemolysin